MITAKYASLSLGEYRKLTSCTYDELIDEYQDQLQLVTGWLGLHLNFIDYEILASGNNYLCMSLIYSYPRCWFNTYHCRYLNSLCMHILTAERLGTDLSTHDFFLTDPKTINPQLGISHLLNDNNSCGLS